MTPRKAIIVYHAGAGRGRAADLITPARHRLVGAGWQVTAVRRTRTIDHASTELVPQLAHDTDLIVVVAGDGTLRDVCAGLLRIGKSIPIGFVPTGNANVIARDQNIPLEGGQAIALLTQGLQRKLDIGILRREGARGPGLAFLSMVEIGFGARVVHLAHGMRCGHLKALYRRWGDPIYAVAALRALVSPAEQPFRIYRDSDANPHWQWAAIITNTRCYAKGWAMAPEARMDDGRLDLVTRQRSGPGVFFRAFHAAAEARRPPAAFSRYAQGRQFICTSVTPLTIQMDGDQHPPGPLATDCPFVISVAPQQPFPVGKELP